MATNFGTQFDITGFMALGYNFGCMLASDTLFDSRGWVFGVKLSEENVTEIECLRVVAMATNGLAKIAITSFVRTIAIGSWLWRGFEWSADRMQILPILCS